MTSFFQKKKEQKGFLFNGIQLTNPFIGKSEIYKSIHFLSYFG